MTFIDMNTDTHIDILYGMYRLRARMAAGESGWGASGRIWAIGARQVRARGRQGAGAAVEAAPGSPECITQVVTCLATATSAAAITVVAAVTAAAAPV